MAKDDLRARPAFYHQREAIFLARARGFDPEGEFQAVCSAAFGWPEEGLNQLRRCLSGQHGTVHGVTRSAFTVPRPGRGCPGGRRFRARALALTARRHRPATTGAGRRGAQRPGRRAAPTVTPSTGGVSLFADHWLAACLLPQRHRIASLLERGGEVAAAHPHLAEAVHAFAEHGYCVTAGARALSLHPNTVK